MFCHMASVESHAKNAPLNHQKLDLEGRPRIIPYHSMWEELPVFPVSYIEMV